ncbi:MAG: hypothetical protein IJ621_04965 [Paludibacteraceae bacterium]|nr:hypothetical protein [Paludibacteraceae bacterium]
MKTYSNPTTNIFDLQGERMMDEINFSYGGGGNGPALMYAPESPKVR